MEGQLHKLTSQDHFRGLVYTGTSREGERERESLSVVSHSDPTEVARLTHQRVGTLDQHSLGLKGLQYNVCVPAEA